MNQIGLIGLGIMGASLARNIASKGYKIGVYNRTYQKTEIFIQEHNHPNITPYQELKTFLDSLDRPRKVILMVNAGEAVDQAIAQIQSYLDEGDVLIDCGNSFWKDTVKRQLELEKNNKKIYLIGCGVSGGWYGALNGPSIMPSGDPKIVDLILPILQDISAKDFQNKSCVTNVGLAGAGHFVKMVHNGIEYALMQGIAEIYDILRCFEFSNQEIRQIFQDFNQKELKSYLLDITVEIFSTKDNLTEGYLIDKISDRAKAKGTGKWTVETAMDLGVFIPSISASVMARIGSSRNQDFKIQKFTPPKLDPYPEQDVFLYYLKLGLQGVYLSAYLQGLDLISKANQDFQWNINLQEVIRIWQGGCIIRSQILADLYTVWSNPIYFDDQIAGLSFVTGFNIYQPLLVLNASKDYLLNIVCDRLPTNLIQAQRDYFGAHGYERIDREGVFTGGWKD